MYKTNIWNQKDCLQKYFIANVFQIAIVAKLLTRLTDTDKTQLRQRGIFLFVIPTFIKSFSQVKCLQALFQSYPRLAGTIVSCVSESVIVFIILQIFFATRVVFEIEGYSPVLAVEYSVT